MNNISLLLCLVFFPISCFARYCIVKRPENRPARISNEMLEMMGASALLGLLAGCFLMFNLGHSHLKPVLFLVAGLVYDLMLRWYFFEREVYRSRGRSKCSRRAALERVRRRSGYSAFALPKALRQRKSEHRPVKDPEETELVEQAS